MEQVYYSLDKHPDVCAQAVVDLIKLNDEIGVQERADRQREIFGPETLAEAARELGDAFASAFDGLAYGLFNYRDTGTGSHFIRPRRKR